MARPLFRVPFIHTLVLPITLVPDSGVHRTWYPKFPVAFDVALYVLQISLLHSWKGRMDD